MLKKNFFFRIFLLCGFISHFSASGQINSPFIKKISINEGLSQSSITSIVQDHLGFIWFGTRDGLNRYEGNKIVVYRHDINDDKSLSNNFIHALYVDKKGTLWVGTENGINKYKSDTDSFELIKTVSQPNDTQSNFIQSISEIEGLILAGTNRGLIVYNPLSNSTVRFFENLNDLDSPGSNLIYSLKTFKNGLIGIGTDNGFDIIKKEGNNFFVLKRFLERKNNLKNLRNNEIRSIVEDKKGRIWMGSYTGELYNYSPENSSVEIYAKISASNKKARIHCIVADTNNTLMIGTDNGLEIFSIENKKSKLFLNSSYENGLSDDIVKSIYIDQTGNKWIGTYLGGVNYYNNTQNPFTSIKKSKYQQLKSNTINCFIEEDKNQILIGTEKGLNLFDLENQVFLPIRDEFHQFDNVNIKSIIKDGRNKYWFGTYNDGVHIVNIKEKSYKHLVNSTKSPNILSNNNVYSMIQESPEVYWLGMHEGGLIRYNIETNQLKIFQPSISSDSLSSKSVRSLFISKKNQLFIGTENGGLLEYNSQKKTFKKYINKPLDSNSISSNSINSIIEDVLGNLWIGTSEGLNYFNITNKTFKSFNQKNGLPSYNILGVISLNPKMLWIATNNGLSMIEYNIDNTGFPKINELTNFSKSNDLPINEYNYNAFIKTKKGELLFGGHNGFVIVDPSKIDNNVSTPNIILTGIKVLNKQLYINDETGYLKTPLYKTSAIDLPYDKASFTLEFANLNFLSGTNNSRVKYRLFGLENEWITTGRLSSVNYTIQFPGEYVFEIATLKSTSQNPNIIKTFTINVKPPFWKTWWMNSLYFILFITGSFVTIYIIIIRNKFKHQLEFEKMEKIRQQDFHEFKLNFFTNITHEFRTPLTLISGPIEKLLLKENFQGIEDVKQAFHNVNRMKELVNQLLNFRKIKEGKLILDLKESNLIDLIKSVYEAFKFEASKREIDYLLITENKILSFYYDKYELENAFYNVISNSFKFTPNNGKITIKISQKKEDNSVIITISDSGIGIEKQMLKKIFTKYYTTEKKLSNGLGLGLGFTKDIIELHEGAITVKSKPGKGSKFKITLPIVFKNNRVLSSEINIDPQEIKPFISESKYRANNLPDFSQLNSEEDQILDRTKILIVEDDIQMRDFISGLFSSKYTVVEAKNGLEGMKKAIRYMPDLIISDVMMPNMDGVEFCKKLKEDHRTIHIPIIILTAKASDESAIESLKYGANDYILKPFNINELIFKVENIVRNRQKLLEKIESFRGIIPMNTNDQSDSEKFLVKIFEIMDENLSNSKFSIDDFAEKMNVSRSVLFKKIKVLTNETPNNLLKKYRLKVANDLLEKDIYKVSEISYKVGFNDVKYFSLEFKKMFNVIPSKIMTK
mgnify:CR=1 FL=1